MSSRTVLILASYAPSLVTFRGALICDLVAAGHRVLAVAPFERAEDEAAVRALGAEPRSIAVERHSFNPLSNLAYAAELRRLIARERPDVFLAYTAKPVAWGAPAARAAGVPFVAALITGVAAVITRILALPRAIDFARKYLPWLAPDKK